MEHPADVTRPFVAYGIFRLGQLAFFQLRDLVTRVTSSVDVTGELRLRDGLPIIDVERHGRVSGDLLEFRPDRAQMLTAVQSGGGGRPNLVALGG